MATKLPPIPAGLPASLEKRLAEPIEKAKKKVLTPQEWKFVQELVGGDGQVTMREAAIRAGYTEKKAGEASRRLTDPTRCPHVVAAIQELRYDLAERYGTTMERHMRDLQRIRDLALQAGAYSAAVQAEYRRGQALGTIYIERKEIRHGTIDTMSKEEVMRKLEEIRRMYGDPGRVIDITPKQINESQERPEPVLEYAPPETAETVPEDIPAAEPQKEDSPDPS